ncbi:hypothetical protein BKA62DRAFT_738619, partial [Auriculariales sp. MPI-PUGE-AT-0066]
SMTSSPPTYTSPLAATPIPTSRAPSPLPHAPVELRLEIANVSSCSPNARRHSKVDSSNFSGHWSGSGLDTDVPLSAGVHGMVHVPLTAHPDSEGAKVIKSPTQRDPIAMLLYLRRAVTLQPPPDKVDASKNRNKQRTRRSSNASTASDTTVVGEQDPSKEKEFAEPWSSRGSFSHIGQAAYVQPKEVEAQMVERKSRVRKPLMITLIVLFLTLFLAAASLGIYSFVHHGF